MPDLCISNVYSSLNFSDAPVSTVVRDYLLRITGEPNLGGIQDAPYGGFTPTVSGGIAPYSFSLQGTWPPGLTIDAGTGAVSGTPTAAGIYPGLSVRVTDVHGTTADMATFTITVTLEDDDYAAWAATM